LNFNSFDSNGKLRAPWQLEIFKSSLKKREKVETILEFIEDPANKKCLEIGCDKGVTSYFLRKGGGLWLSTDIDRNNVETTKRLVKENVLYFGEGKLPFLNRSFDMILAIDTLEHIEDDEGFLKDLHRILKDEGTLYISVPCSGSTLFLNKMAQKAGMTLDYYGHKREGYSKEALKEKLHKTSFRMTKFKYFSRFVTELIELLINFGYIFILNKGKKQKGIKGSISPSTLDDFNQHSKSFSRYRKIYPFLKCITRVDSLIYFTKGYACICEAKKSFPDSAGA
jgi:2-polyprenyl-3-methyl-5-hydroxy-6-metoxy-1,4-benzoquinol methylase